MATMLPVVGKLPAIWKNRPETQEANFSSQDGTKNVLGAVEALMKEVQILKNKSKQQERQLEYYNQSTKIHNQQITSLHEQLSTLHNNQKETTDQLRVLLEDACAASKTVKTMPITKEMIEAIIETLVEKQKEIFLLKDFEDFPTFDEWCESGSVSEEESPHMVLEPILPKPPLTLPRTPRELSVIESLPIGEHKELILISSDVSGFLIENGSKVLQDLSSVDDISNGLIDASQDVPYYQCYFVGKPHTNYIVEDPIQGFFFISIANPEGSGKEELKKYGTIVRTEMGTFIHKMFRNRKKKATQLYKISPTTPWREVKQQGFKQDLKQMEVKELAVRQHYKVAILNVKEGQNQTEMFSNNDITEDFQEFLDFIGETVPLAGWTKYTGGLDTSTGTTGTHSVFSTYCGVEIMFHVSTLIPFSDHDEQQVDRKRHLGNDVVVIIFKEGKTPFTPTVIRSHFNTIFLVVQKYPADDKENTYYQLSVAARESVEPFPPYLPPVPIFKKNSGLRSFLHQKIINGERKTYKTIEFKKRLARARRGNMDVIAKLY